MSNRGDRSRIESLHADDSSNSDSAHRESSTNDSVVSADSELTIGWREWVSLPDLGLPAVKAKVDTGARTSALHAFDIERFSSHGGQDMVAFTVQPLQRDVTTERRCQAPLLDIRKVTDSGGHVSERYFISTQLCLGELTREVEITLSERRDMLFRMLLGRTSIVPGVLVDPQLSYTVGRLDFRTLYLSHGSEKAP
ncbi:MAG: RimK/LysX family protein [Granulosicoccus sp.]|nr:RimK/LysX family protein [Granulosicoccus sp.]